MNKLFYFDIITRQKISFQNLLNDILLTEYYNPYCKSKNFYSVFYSIILSLVLGREIILLDDDFSTEEVKSLIGDIDIEKTNVLIGRDLSAEISTIDMLYDKIMRPSKEWKITLFTSGTTGLPKKISHNFETITRSVRITDKHSNSIWGFAYNPTHMAGIQVFFQALLNRNTIVRLFNLDKVQIINQVELMNITHISATPTFYRLLLPNDAICNSVINLTSGGEKFDHITSLQLKHVFPNSTIKNVYASTEAGFIFSSDGEYFTLKSEYVKYVKIEDNELFLHKSIMGILDTISILKDNWYATGDIVEVISNNPIKFKFLHRKNEMINVGGYKVNPFEVEDEIRKIPGILDVRVYAKKNSVLGSIVCAEVVKSIESLTESQIRLLLKSKLQEYKIPRLIQFVLSIATTRTGKVLRN